MHFKAKFSQLALLLIFWFGVPLLIAETPDHVKALQKQGYALARQAALEKNSLGILKSWLLEQAMIEQGYELPQPELFYRLIWLALDRDGLCPDLAPEPDDLGLWSVVFYNFAVKSYRESSQMMDSLTPAIPGQDLIRFVDLESSLSLAEWKSLKVFRGPCRLHDHLNKGDSKLPVRTRKLQTLLALLTQARNKLSPKVEGRSLIDARLEQIQLALARDMKLPPANLPGKSLDSLSAEDWARLDLATAAELFPVWQKGHTPTEVHRWALQITDELLRLHLSEKLNYWIAQASPLETRENRLDIWQGERGANLLSQDGFSERSIIALYRGIEQIEANRLEDAFRSFALARKFAGSSRIRKDIDWQLANWLKYAAIRYRVSDDLLKYLTTYLEPEDLRDILKQILWQAAFHGDAAMVKLFQLPQLPPDLRKAKVYFEAVNHGQLQHKHPIDSSERGQYLRFIREYCKQLELASFPLLLRQQPTLAQLERDLRRDTDPQWKMVRTETLEQMTRLSQALRTSDIKAQGQRDRQSMPQALGSSVVPPARPDLWPFPGTVAETVAPQLLGLTLELDGAGQEHWRIFQPQSGVRE